MIEGVVELAPKAATGRSPMNRRYQRRAQTGEQTPSESGAVLVWLEAGSITPPVNDSSVVLDQVDIRFQPRILAVRQHEVVRVRNSDPVYHNVFSFSPVKRFDVGRRPQGDYYDVRFDRQGVVDVFCDIHSNMHAVIYVVSPNTLEWASIENGEAFLFTDLPNDTYTLNIYSSGYQLFTTEVTVDNSTIDLGTITLNL